MTLHGLYTAIITPFNEDGSIDFEAFGMLIDNQLDGGVDGIVVAGSTGEAATMSLDEKTSLWSFAAERVNGQVPIIAGSGSNNTAESAKASKAAQEAGARGLLIVTPYYNKPTLAGLIAHHQAIAEASELPQILYNVPGRSALNMSAETQLAITEACPNIIGTKEASADLEQMAEVIRHAPSGFALVAGDDSLVLPISTIGGKGVIAVISNYAPRTYGALVQHALKGALEEARAVEAQLAPWYGLNFLESNPIPVKYIVHKTMGIGLNYRLPLTQPSQVTVEHIDKALTTIPN
jgi:4-hydroxy-tetrahydrodipicolinate synthase